VTAANLGVRGAVHRASVGIARARPFDVTAQQRSRAVIGRNPIARHTGCLQWYAWPWPTRLVTVAGSA
jgi:hypothetical protein